MHGANLFARITKVDEAKREVWGRAVQEMPDKDDEIFDYDTSKPLFAAWSADFAKATDGASLGNIRAMHGKVAAGKAIALNFDDAAKAIDIGAKIVDENEWQKCLQGVYTGFSIGGSYVKKWQDDDNAGMTRYTAAPAEISIVDNPCVPSARFFEVRKADGTTEKVEFKALAKVIEVVGNDDDVAALAKAMNDSKLAVADVIKLIAKREFSADDRKKAVESGAAMSDGSFPIENKGDLGDAIRAYGRAKDKAKAKAHITARAKALGAESELPADWEKLAQDALDKGMWNVGRFAEALESLACVAASAQSDLDWEDDSSPIPAKLRGWIAEGAEIITAMTEEESQELVASLTESAGVGMTLVQPMMMAARAQGLGKAFDALEDAAVDAFAKGHLSTTDIAAALRECKEGEPIRPALRKAIVAKAGKLTAAQQDKIQAIHDHSVNMGADCDSGDGAGKAAKAAPAGDLAKANVELVSKVEALTKDVERLKKQPMPHRVTLRTVSKEGESGRMTDGAGAEVRAAMIAKFSYDDYVKFPDGQVNWEASDEKYLQKFGAAQ